MISPAQTTPPTAGSPIVKASEIKAFPLRPGVVDTTFQLSNGKDWAVRLSIPELPASGSSVPLVLALHWAGGGNTYREYSECLAFPGLEALGAIIVAPSAEGKHWLEPGMEIRVIKLVRQLKKYWPVDPDRVLITGYSNGGIGSWVFANKFPSLFTAGIPMAGSYQAAKIKSPLFVIHGEQDELFRESQIKAVIAASAKRGSTISYTAIPAFSHYMACSYVEALRLAAERVRTETWSSKN